MGRLASDCYVIDEPQPSLWSRVPCSDFQQWSLADASSNTDTQMGTFITELKRLFASSSSYARDNFEPVTSATHLFRHLQSQLALGGVQPGLKTNALAVLVGVAMSFASLPHILWSLDALLQHYETSSGAGAHSPFIPREFLSGLESHGREWELSLPWSLSSPLDVWSETRGAVRTLPGVGPSSSLLSHGHSVANGLASASQSDLQRLRTKQRRFSLVPPQGGEALSKKEAKDILHVGLLGRAGGSSGGSFASRALATDGKYLYMHCAEALMQVGTGFHGTTRGRQYAQIAQYRSHERLQLACVVLPAPSASATPVWSSKLYVLSSRMPWMVVEVIDTDALRVEGLVQLGCDPEFGYPEATPSTTQSVAFTSGMVHRAEILCLPL